MLAYIYFHTLTRSYRRESDDDRHTRTHTYTHPCLPLILRAHKHSHISGRFFYSTPRSTSWHTHTHTHNTHTHTHTSSYELEICLAMTHTYTHSYPRLVALQNTYFSSSFTEAFLLHACGVTRNWRTYFISVRPVFLVETVVLQTVLWDIRAWSARFLVSNCICRNKPMTYIVYRIVNVRICKLSCF